MELIKVVSNVKIHFIRLKQPPEKEKTVRGKAKRINDLLS